MVCLVELFVDCFVIVLVKLEAIDVLVLVVVEILFLEDRVVFVIVFDSNLSP